MPSSLPSAFPVERRSVPVVRPYRLDLTVAVLRRFSTNVVDRTDANGRYLRILDEQGGPLTLVAAQAAPDALELEVTAAPGEHERAFALAARMLGVDRNVTGFYRAARTPPWLHALAARMRGVKPPRYPTLWEACVNAIVFQQVSLHAATAILGRAIQALGTPHERAGVRLFAFPSAQRLLEAPDASLRAAGLSLGKVATLRRVAEALATGALDEARLAQLDSPVAAGELCAIKGIGPWTAAVILLRGFGRLDVFPGNDSGAARSLALAAGDTPVDLPELLTGLAEWRGFLYYHLLLARLEARGEVGPAATVRPAS